jgi:HK97 family phage major capsid protein
MRSKELDQIEATLDKTLKSLETQVKAKEKKDMDKANKLASKGAGQSGVVYGNRSTSLENKCLESFGVSHPADLLKTNTSRPAFQGVGVGFKQMATSFKEAVDISRFISQIYYDQPLDKIKSDRKREDETRAKVDYMLESAYAKDHLAPMIKSFGTGLAGAGAEWIPTAISTQFVEEFELEKRVANAFREMPMPTNPFKLPVQTDVTVARIATENAALTGKNFGTTTIDFDATKLGEFYPLSEEMNEDSAPAILQIARAEVAEAQIRARETIAINGDTTSPHMDLDVTEADDARKVAKGLRKLALENSANGSVIDFAGPVTTAKLDEMRTAMGKFGIGVRNMAYVFSPTTYNQAVSLDEVTSVEKFGGQATIVTGALAAFRGIPVVISEFVREDVDLNGVHTAVPAADSKGLVHLVNLQRFWYGIRRPIQVRVQMDLPNQDRFLLASYSRLDFQGHAQSDKEVSSVLGVNVTI